MEHTSAAGEWVCDKGQPSHSRYVRIFDWPKHIGNATNRESAESICFAHNAEVAALREQLEQAQAALKQKDEKARKIVWWDENSPQGIEPETLIAWMGEAARKLLTIQPDSSALKAVIEAETAKLREAVLELVAAGFDIKVATGREPDKATRFFKALHTTAALAASAQKAGQP